MRGRTAAVLVVVVSLSGATLRAHEGHAHQILGTVSVRQDDRLEVKGTDGKMTLVTLTAKTKVRRGDVVVKPADIRKGERVVVMATESKGKDGKTVIVASEVRLSPSGTGGK